MASLVVSVETVTHRTQMRRFVDVPFLLFGSEPRWSRPVHAYEQWRFDEGRHPFFHTGTAAYFLARVGGQPAGRVTAHIARPGVNEGTFGFLAAPDDERVTIALLEAAAEWLAEQGAVSMVGPMSWTANDEFGAPVAGVDHPGVTGRPWHPGYYAQHLAAAGLEPGGERHTYRLATGAVSSSGDTAFQSGDPDGIGPPHAGRFQDDRLVLDAAAAVPDVSGALADASLRSAWQRARQVSQRRFSTAVCVTFTGEPEVAVRSLLAVAADAGYSELIAPWAPPGTAPETTHRVFSRRL